MWILALDVGTSSIRAIGYDAAGRALPGAGARVGYEPATTSDGGSELDAEELVAATASAMDRCLAALAYGSQDRDRGHRGSLLDFSVFDFMGVGGQRVYRVDRASTR